jgi:hypothetical protein
MYKFCFDTSTEDVQDTRNGSYQLYLNFPLKCSKIAVSNIVIPYSFYNITDKNNEILINESSYYLTTGNYNGKELMAMLVGILSSKYVTTNFSECKYNVNNMKCSFKIQAGFEQIKVTFTNSYLLFGAEELATYTINTGDEVVMPNVANTQSINSILIRSNLQSNYIYGNDKTNVLFRMSVDKPPGSLLTYSSTSTDICVDVNNITNLNIQLTDEQGHIIDLNSLPFRIEFICIP